MYELVLRANFTVAHILELQTFSNLHSAESEQLDWRKTGWWEANSCSNAIFWLSISHILTGWMSLQGFPPEESRKEK